MKYTYNLEILLILINTVMLRIKVSFANENIYPHSIFSYNTYNKVERMRHILGYGLWISHVYRVECYYGESQFPRNTKTKM